jgi:hypothetical protein
VQVLRRRSVVDVDQKQKDVSSFVDIYNTKIWEIESPGNQTTGSRPARDDDISQADVNLGHQTDATQELCHSRECCEGDPLGCDIYAEQEIDSGAPLLIYLRE